MTSVDKTVAYLSTVYGFVSDEAQCEALREHLRVICTVRDVPFTLHEVSMRATAVGVPVDKELRVRTITEDAQLCSIRMVNPVRITSAAETREVTDMQVSGNAEVWLTQIGFNFGFEFYKEGVRYGAILEPPSREMRALYVHIFVYKLKKISERGNFTNLIDSSSGYMVELQCEEDPQSREFGVRLLNFAKTLSAYLYIQEVPTR